MPCKTRWKNFSNIPRAIPYIPSNLWRFLHSPNTKISNYSEQRVSTEILQQFAVLLNRYQCKQCISPASSPQRGMTRYETHMPRLRKKFISHLQRRWSLVSAKEPDKIVHLSSSRCRNAGWIFHSSTLFPNETRLAYLCLKDVEDRHRS